MPNINKLTNEKCPLFSRVWAMPNRNTFHIKPIKKFVEKYWNKDIISSYLTAKIITYI